MKPNNVEYIENDEVYHPDSCNTLDKAWKSGRVELHALTRHNYPGSPLSDDEIPGINTIGYWSSQSQQEWGLDWHRNEGVEITFLETGTLPFATEASSHVMMPNDLTFTRPWQLHKVGNPTIGVGKLHWIIIDVGVRQPHQEWKWPSWVVLSKTVLLELTKILRQNEQPVFSVNADIRKCFQSIGSLILESDVRNVDSWLRIYVNELLMLLYEQLKKGRFVLNESLTDTMRTVELFIKELDTSYNELWTVQSMASHTRLGVTQFTHYFKQLTNHTPMQYLNSLRLDIAAAMLARDSLTNISDICYDCGFSSTQYFSTIFSKRFGYSPSSYRQEKATFSQTV
jgi:AraC-like DNA-binding protein